MLGAVFLLLILAGISLVLIFVWRTAKKMYVAELARNRRQPNARPTPKPNQKKEPGLVAAIEVAYELVTNETAKGRGYVVRRLRDQKLLSWQFLPKEDGLQCLDVVGESHHMEDLQQPGFAAGFPIRLTPEPDNPVDQNAVAVRDASGKYQAGYLSREDAPKILKRIKKEIGFQALVMWEINIDGQRVSLRILLIDAGTSLKLEMPDEALSIWEAYLKAPAPAK